MGRLQGLYRGTHFGFYRHSKENKIAEIRHDSLGNDNMQFFQNRRRLFAVPTFVPGLYSRQDDDCQGCCHRSITLGGNNPLKSDPGRDITLCAVVPSQLPSLLKSPYVGRIRNLIIGGAPLSPEYESVLAEYEFNAYVTYGMTETCSHVALRKTGEEYYQALSDISFSTDERGCLMINSSERSFKKLVTNDIVELIDSRSFKWKGRYDNVINTGGIKVFPEEIERKIASAVKEKAFFITSRESSKWGREVVLVIEGKERDADLAGKLEALLEKPERPKEIIYVSAIPRTLSGKIKRNLDVSIQ